MKWHKQQCQWFYLLIKKLCMVNVHYIRIMVNINCTGEFILCVSYLVLLDWFCLISNQLPKETNQSRCL